MASLAALFAFGILMFVTLYYIANPPFRDREFDSADWKASDSPRPTIPCPNLNQHTKINR